MTRLFFLVLLLWCGAASAGYLYNGKCFATQSEQRAEWCADQYKMTLDAVTGVPRAVTRCTSANFTAASATITVRDYSGGGSGVDTVYSSIWPVGNACNEVTYGSLLPAKVATYMELWALFLGAAVVILCAKALYNRFRIDHGN